MDFSRRLFLGGTAALAAASFIKTAVEVPTLWGDMIHDDAPALNALFRGDPVRVLSGKALLGERPALIGSRHMVGSTVNLVSEHIYTRDISLTAAEGFEGSFILRAQASDLRLDGQTWLYTRNISSGGESIGGIFLGAGEYIGSA